MEIFMLQVPPVVSVAHLEEKEEKESKVCK